MKQLESNEEQLKSIAENLFSKEQLASEIEKVEARFSAEIKLCHEKIEKMAEKIAELADRNGHAEV